MFKINSREIGERPPHTIAELFASHSAIPFVGGLLGFFHVWGVD